MANKTVYLKDYLRFLVSCLFFNLFIAFCDISKKNKTNKKTHWPLYTAVCRTALKTWTKDENIISNRSDNLVGFKRMMIIRILSVLYTNHFNYIQIILHKREINMTKLVCDWLVSQREGRGFSLIEMTTTPHLTTCWQITIVHDLGDKEIRATCTLNLALWLDYANSDAVWSTNDNIGWGGRAFGLGYIVHPLEHAAPDITTLVRNSLCTPVIDNWHLWLDPYVGRWVWPLKPEDTTWPMTT